MYDPNAPIDDTPTHAGDDTAATLRSQLFELAANLDGWEYAELDLDDYPPLMGLNNFESPAMFEAASKPMHIGVIPTEHQTCLVIPFEARPVSAQIEYGTDSPEFDDPEILGPQWELGSNNPEELLAAFRIELSVSSAVDRVRQHCSR